MKKILAFVAMALVSITAAISLDLGGIKGTWKDKNYDANWTFQADGHIVLTIASTGKVVYDFNDSNITNFKVNAGASGVTVSFDCAATHRSYKFTKPVSLNADLDMVIDPDWTSKDYSTKITFVK